MRLTDKAIKHADTAGKKRLKLFDGGGLHLMITETGGKYWRFRYRYQGKDCTLSLGCYPHISLKQARQLHRDAQTLLHQGIDPHQQKMQQKRQQQDSIRQAQSFEHIACQWYERRKPSYSNAKAAQQVINTLKQYVFPMIGKQPINTISVADIMCIIDPIFRINVPAMVRSGGKPKGLLVLVSSLSTRRLRIAKLTVGDI